MDTIKRIALCRMIEQMNENENCSQRLGLKNISVFLKTEEKVLGFRRAVIAAEKESEENVDAIVCSIDGLCVC